MPDSTSWSQSSPQGPRCSLEQSIPKNSSADLPSSQDQAPALRPIWGERLPMRLIGGSSFSTHIHTNNHTFTHTQTHCISLQKDNVKQKQEITMILMFWFPYSVGLLRFLFPKRFIFSSPSWMMQSHAKIIEKCRGFLNGPSLIISTYNHVGIVALFWELLWWYVFECHSTQWYPLLDCWLCVWTEWGRGIVLYVGWRGYV